MTWLRKPSPALLLAMVALIVALVGTAGADPTAPAPKPINGAKIKKHSIPLSALSTDAVTTLQGTTGATNVTVVSSTCGPDPCQTATVTCPPGTQEVGGGGLAVGNQLLFESRPSPQSGTPTGWEVAGGAADPPATGSVAAYALCASP
jgi:hypothetical protein